MSVERVKDFFEKEGIADRIQEFDVSSATVELAARALNCEGCRIAKTLSFHLDDKVILIVAAGDAKIDNRKFRDALGAKPHMLKMDEVEPRIGHAPGGVCAFGINDGVSVYCDVSLKRFDYVYPAAGNDHSGVKLNCDELYDACDAKGWVDVCKGWE